MVAVLLRDVVGDGDHQPLVPIVHQTEVTTRRARHTRYAHHQNKGHKSGSHGSAARPGPSPDSSTHRIGTAARHRLTLVQAVVVVVVVLSMCQRIKHDFLVV